VARIRDDHFAGKVAIVTGGAGGIGQQVARTLANAGARIVIVDLDGGGADEVADEINGTDGEASAIRADLGDETDVARLVEATVDRFGGVDILDNNAALTDANVLASDTSVTDMTVEVWDQMMSVNLRSQMLMCKHVIPHMIRRGGGAIVNMSSGAAMSGDLTRTAYSVSKAGISAFTAYVATQYGRQGIRANTITPGLILTAPVRAQIPSAMLAGYSRKVLTPFLGEPQDIADLVSFLVSDQARYITGQSIQIDGGMSVHGARLPALE
jgi:NAD(P)-dependent dehydrogenase (short-subunit alcohol dehydrogenase family)